MNHKLPFALSAIGLMTLAIYQPALAKDTGPSLTIELQAAGAQAPAGAVSVDGKVLSGTDANGQPLYLVFGEKGFSGQIIFKTTLPDGSTNTGGAPVEGKDKQSAEASFLQGYAKLLAAAQRKGLTVNGLSDVLSDAAGIDSPLVPGVTGTGRLTTSTKNLGNAVIANSFADPSAIQAQVTTAQVGAAVENAAGATLATSANTVSAATTVISQLASQSIASGETSLAVATLATTTDTTTSTATVSDSVAGVRINNNGTLSGASSVTVDNNALTATARSNDSTSTLVATGANAGAAGNSAASPDKDNAYPAPGLLTVTGDLLATGVQRLDQGSAVSATIGGSTLGLTDGASAGTVNTISGGITVTDNRATAVADGNRLALSLTDNLSGGDVDSTAYALQTVNDTNVTATTGASVGVDITTLTSSAAAVTANTVQAAATGNRATAAVTARPDGSSDSLVADVEQFVRAGSTAVQIQATAAGNTVGRSGATATSAVTNVADNRLTAIATGNDQATTADLGAGVQAGTARIEGNQTLVVDGADLTLGASVSGSTIGTVATTDALARTTVSGNTAVGQVIGNNATQSLGNFAGSREAALNVSQQQTTQGNATNTLSLSAGVSTALSPLGIGASATTLAAPQLTVSDNQVASLVSLNRQSQALGAQSGSSAAAGSTAVSATQTADSASAQAQLAALRIGVINAGAAITADPTRAAAEITVTGNQVNAQAELNRSLQTLDSASGNFAGALTLDTTQTANAAAGGQSDVSAILNKTGVGLYGGTGALNIQDGRLDLVVNGNSLATQAQSNLAQTSVGALSGTVALPTAASRLGAGITQTAADTSVRAQNLDTGLGISDAAPASAPLFTNGTRNVSVNVTDNTQQALARQNNANVVLGAVSGQVNQGQVGAVVSQTSSGTGSVLSQNSGVYAGVTPAVGVGGAGLGNASVSTALTVSGNTVRADAADNLSTIVGNGIAGSVGATANVGAQITQSSSGSQINAQNSIIDLGAAEQNGGTVGGGAGTTAVTVADNTVIGIASGNNSTASLGGVSGDIAANGVAGVTTTQTLDSQVTASTTLVKAGVNDASLGSGAGATSLSVSDNAVATAVSGNDSRVVDLGQSAANIAGTLNAVTTQTVNANASMSANSSNLRIGATGITTFGTQGAVAVTVDGNDVRTSATANNSNVTGSVSGTLASTGSVTLNATQTLNGSAAGIVATSGLPTESNVIGVQASFLGANGSASVANNAVTSAVAGNRVLNTLDSAAFSSATGTLSFNATQTVNGTALASGDLLSSVDNTTVGVVNTSGSSLPAASVSGNRLVASTVANESSRVLNGLSGNFNAATQTVAMLDTQTTSNAVLKSSVANSQIGSQLLSNGAIPTSLTVNGNAVLAQSIANSSSQQVSLDGVSTRGGPLTSLNASQSLLNSTVNASLTSVNVGLKTGGTTGAGMYTGAAVTSGNSLGANAIGNQSSLVRSGR